jgi:hypothetical protein
MRRRAVLRVLLMIMEENTKSKAQAAMQFLKPFIGQSQLKCLAELCRGEEKQFFFDKLCELATVVHTMPKVYQQDGLGDKAIIYLHYFKGGCDWHITERDTTTEQGQAFGLANLGYGADLGYISIEELIEHNVELDLYWTPKTIGDLREEAVTA